MVKRKEAKGKEKGKAMEREGKGKEKGKERERKRKGKRINLQK